MTRVLVVGAGHNGLVAAIHLAAHGLDVTVLEHAPRPGGASTSRRDAPRLRPRRSRRVRADDRRLPGHARAGARAIDWVDPRRRRRASVPRRERDRAAPRRGRDGELARLRRAGWTAAMEQLLPLASRWSRAILAPLPPVRAPARLALALRSDGAGVGAPAARLGGGARARPVRGRPARDRLAGGAPPSTAGCRRPRPGAARSACCCSSLGHSHGWPLPRGGMRCAGRRAGPRAREREGAAIRCEATVAARARARRPRGRRAARGRRGDRRRRRPHARSAPACWRGCCPPARCPARLHRRLRIWRYGTGAVQARLRALRPVPWTAAEARSRGRRARRRRARGADAARPTPAQRGEVPERPALVVGQQSLHDPTRAPAGQHTLYVYGARAGPLRRSPTTPSPTASRRSSSASRPGSPRSCSSARSRTPAQTEQENPSLVGGDLARRLLRARPAAAVPPRPAAVPLPHPAARPLRRGRVGPSRRRRPRHERPRRRPRPAARPQAPGAPDAGLRRVPRGRDRRAAAGLLRRADRLRAPARVAGRRPQRPRARARRPGPRRRRRVRGRRQASSASTTGCGRSTTSRTGSAASTSAATSATSPASGASSRSTATAPAPSSTSASTPACSSPARSAARSPTP